jgi:hypothetical protein
MGEAAACFEIEARPGGVPPASGLIDAKVRDVAQ